MAYKIKIKKEKICENCHGKCCSYYHGRSICSNCIDRFKAGNQLKCLKEKHHDKILNRLSKPKQLNTYPKGIYNERSLKRKW